MNDTKAIEALNDAEVLTQALIKVEPQTRGLYGRTWYGYAQEILAALDALGGYTLVRAPKPTGDLPPRIVVDQHGHYWRDYGDFWSMCPTSTENVATEAVAVYVPTATLDAAAQEREALRAAGESYIRALTTYFSDQNPEHKKANADAANAAYDAWKYAAYGPHQWTTDAEHSYQWCRVCLGVRQANGSSDGKPCRGPSRIGLRALAPAAAQPQETER